MSTSPNGQTLRRIAVVDLDKRELAFHLDRLLRNEQVEATAQDVINELRARRELAAAQVTQVVAAAALLLAVLGIIDGMTDEPSHFAGVAFLPLLGMLGILISSAVRDWLNDRPHYRLAKVRREDGLTQDQSAIGSRGKSGEATRP